MRVRKTQCKLPCASIETLPSGIRVSLLQNEPVLQKPEFVSWWHLPAWQCVDMRKHSLWWQGRLDNPPQLLSIHRSWQNLPGGTWRYTWRWQLMIRPRQYISKCQADTCHREQTSAPPSAPANATCSPFSSHLFFRASIYVTHLCHLCSL